MPLKYAFGQPEMVRIVGMAHGVLWMLYVGLAALGQIDYKWPLKTTALLLIASMLPFGPIVADAKLLKKIEQSIGRIDSDDYGYCDETGEPIGVGRLLARPTATLSLEAQQRRELKQKMFGD